MSACSVDSEVDQTRASCRALMEDIYQTTQGGGSGKNGGSSTSADTSASLKSSPSISRKLALRRREAKVSLIDMCIMFMPQPDR